MKEIIKYRMVSGREPFQEWFEKLEWVVQARIDASIIRIASGLSRNIKPVGNGVYELKVDIGPGYRVYFGNDGLRLIVLLLGGDKSRQSKDIQKAAEYWSDYYEKK